MATIFHACIDGVCYLAVNAKDEQEARWEVEAAMLKNGDGGLCDRWIAAGRVVKRKGAPAKLKLENYLRQ